MAETDARPVHPRRVAALQTGRRRHRKLARRSPPAATAAPDHTDHPHASIHYDAPLPSSPTRSVQRQDRCITGVSLMSSIKKKQKRFIRLFGGYEGKLTQAIFHRYGS